MRTRVYVCGAVGDMCAGEHISVWAWLGICVRGTHIRVGVAGDMCAGKHIYRGSRYPRYSGNPLQASS